MKINTLDLIEYSNTPMKIVGYSCRCGWVGDNFEVVGEFERTHPLNKHIYPSEPGWSTRAHITSVRRCPQCKRWWYADGKLLPRVEGCEVIYEN